MRVNVFLNVQNKRYLLGTLANESGICFQYAPSFLKNGLPVSPIAMPLSQEIWKSSNFLFDGLPGFVADSLPDGWGKLLLDRQLRKLGRRLHEVSPLERLCWVGNQGMGALEYEPQLSEKFNASSLLNIDTLAENVEQILNEHESQEALDLLVQTNGSSAGARPKIVCLVSDDFKHLIRGTDAVEGFHPWIVKFRNSDDPLDIGVQEYISSIVAGRAGLSVPQTHLFESSKGPGWFAAKRFDRCVNGKIHMVTAAGLLHCNFRDPCLDYETLMVLSERLVGHSALMEMFKRGVLNYSLNNADDHAKNFSFLMDGNGRWSLSPIYDVVASSIMTHEHMTSVLGNGKNPDRKTFLKLAARFDISEKEALNALDEVAEAVALYPELAKQYQVEVPACLKEI